MKEFVVCYTLEDEVKREIIIKGMDVKKEEVIQEILNKIAKQSYYILRGEQGNCWINSSAIRYVRVLDEQTVPEYQYN